MGAGFSGPLAPAGKKLLPGAPQGLVKKTVLDYIILTEQPWAVNSAVECHPHTVEVTGSNPVPPTMQIQGVTDIGRGPFFFPATILLPFS